MDDRSVEPRTKAGDPFAYAAASAGKLAEERLLARLEERLAHEIASDEDRMELRDRVMRLRKNRQEEH